VIFLNKEIGPNQYPFIVAEISCNHKGDLTEAKHIIEAAKACGADAVKIQLYTPDDMTIPGLYIKHGPNQWAGRELYELYTRAQTNFELAEQMMIYANQVDIPCFASVFGAEGVEKLESIFCQAYKIASFELTDLELIKKVARTGKPVVLSTGMANINEIDTATCCMKPENYILLHCVSSYPTLLPEANLWRIQHLANHYDAPVGFSDHTRGYMVGPLAVAAGAQMLEKHLMLSEKHQRQRDGRVTEDAAFSVDPDEFKTYIQRCRLAAEAMFDTPVPSEASSLELRRSIYVTNDVKKGEAFTKENTRVIRPALGMHGHKYMYILDCKARVDIPAGTPLTKELLA